ncbi:MAG: hypothetical protein E6R03_10145 [Hyphomicrobiaceae bacterium]|nr:MAG: hypothetical protein E6R03_10145 [Hyphomicrobiaceae bacterium]
MVKLGTWFFAAAFSACVLWAVWVVNANMDIPGCPCVLHDKPTVADTIKANNLMVEILKNPEDTGRLTENQIESLFRYRLEDPDFLPKLYLLKTTELYITQERARRRELEKEINTIVAMAVKPNGVSEAEPIMLAFVMFIGLCITWTFYNGPVNS